MKTTTTSKLAYQYVKAIKDYTAIRENAFIAFYFDKLQPLLQQSFEKAEQENATAERKIEILHEIFIENADKITDQIMLAHRPALKKNLVRSIRVNKRVHTIEKRIMKISKAGLNDLVAEVIRNEIKIMGQMNNKLWKKLFQPAVAGSIT